MNHRVLSFASALALTGLTFFGVIRVSPAAPPPVYQPPLSSLPNFGYYNPAPYRPPSLNSLLSRSAYSRSNLRPSASGHYPLHGAHMMHMGRLREGNPPPPDLNAHITVRAPADAELWFNDVKIAGQGAIRKFHSPPLERDRRYSYKVRIRWMQDGREITQTRKMMVAAGARLHMDFTTPRETEK